MNITKLKKAEQLLQEADTLIKEDGTPFLLAVTLGIQDIQKALQNEIAHAEKVTIKSITHRDFDAYEEVRLSGATNMFDTRMVAELSGLDQKTILRIMSHYSALKAKYMPKETAHE